MINRRHINEMITVLTKELLEKRGESIWRGKLSSSAISTSVSVFALSMADKEMYAQQIDGGVKWLLSSMHDDGSWGDSIESRSNMTATLLSYAALYSQDAAPDATKSFLTNKFGGINDEKIVKGVLAYYGKDLTFSAPILVMCALAGVIKSWDKIPQLPFELSVLPQRFFKFLRLPVVSYAIPALIAVGILCHRKKKKGLFYKVRESFVEKSLKVMVRLQPSNGGFLEAAPLTAFVTMCMCGAGYREHAVTRKAVLFLTGNVRDDGAWPIDTDLACWVTALSIKALDDDIPDRCLFSGVPVKKSDDIATYKVIDVSVRKQCCYKPVNSLGEKLLFNPSSDSTHGDKLNDDKQDNAMSNSALNDSSIKELLLEAVRKNAFTFKHPFTGAKEGGWGWNDLPGAAPDADDTAGNLIALHILSNGVYCSEAEKGIEWLLDLQNNDGGIPTFCKGWGKLPFDRSSADISAHSLMAFELWMPVLPVGLQQRCRKGIVRLLKWMKKTQAADGSWTPLWFGDQDASDERSPVYGTAVAVEHLGISEHPVALDISRKGIQFLLAAQNEDGGWGGTRGLPSKVTLTAKALSALTTGADNYLNEIEAGVDFLYRQFCAGEINRPEPIGLYFSRLWYSEELYNITFVLSALKNIRKMLDCSDN